MAASVVKDKAYSVPFIPWILDVSNSGCNFKLSNTLHAPFHIPEIHGLAFEVVGVPLQQLKILLL